MGRKIPMWQILLVIAFVVAALLYTVIGYDGYIQIPLICGGAFAAIVAILNGWKWSYLEKGILNSIDGAMQACLILLAVGCLIGTWIEGGVVPTMIYYGLMLLKPGIFLVATCIICCIVSLATGSSWTTAGTVGIALIGVSSGLGIPLPITAGAIISGAYFGDKMSPLSDSTNLAPAMAGSNLFDHIRHMVWTVTPSLIISLILFAIIGMRYSGSTNTDQMTELMTVIQENFYISPILLIPPAFIILMVIFKIPALPGLFAGGVLGALCAVFFQGTNFMETMTYVMYDGYVSETGVEFVDNLLSRGGLVAMMYPITIVFCAMVLAGVLDASNMIHTIVMSLMRFVKGTGSLVLLTVITCISSNLLCADQYVSIVVPGRMYKEIYEDRRLKNKNLSRVLEDAGTMTSSLIPWTTCGAYMTATLGVATLAYMPFCFLNLCNPIVSVFYGFTGISMEKMTEEEYQAVLARKEAEKIAAEKALMA